MNVKWKRIFICGAVSDDEMEIENETLDDSEDSCTSSASSGSNISATPGPIFTATPGPTHDMTNKNPLVFFPLTESRLHS